MGKERRLLSGYSSIGRDARLLLASSAIWGVSWGVYQAVWQLYLKSAGYGGAGIGTYSLVSGLSMTLLTLPSGVIADRVRRKGLNVLGSFSAAISTLVVLCSTSMPSLIASALMGGISWAISGPAWNAMFAETVEESGMEAGYGLNAFLQNVTMAVGSVLGWAPELLVSRRGLTYLKSYRMFLYLPVALQFLSTIPVIMVRERFEPTPSSGRLRLKAGRTAIKFAVTNALVGFGAGFSIHLMSYYLSTKFGVESGPIGTLFALSSILGAPAYLASAPLSSAIGPVKGVVIPQVISIPILMLIPFCRSFSHAAALYIPRNMLMNMSNPLIQALMMKLTPEEERGSVSSISQMAWNLPGSVSNRLGGITMDQVGLDVPIFFTSAFYAAYVTSFYLLFRKEEMAGP